MYPADFIIDFPDYRRNAVTVSNIEKGKQQGVNVMERYNKQNKLKYMVMAAVFAAMIYVMTAFLHVPTHQGYIHVGDGVIYLAAALLPAPYAAAAGAIGAGLSDYLSGYALWVVPTMLIKSSSALLFTGRKPTIITKRNILALFPAALLCAGGYYLTGALLYGSFITALADVPTNLVQSAASSALFVFLGLALDRMGFKKRILTRSHG